MPGVPEQPKPREEHGQGQKREEVDSATQTDEPVDGGTLSQKKVDQIRHDPKAVVHSQLQEELDKEFEERGLHFDKPGSSDEEGKEGEGDSSNKKDGKQSAGDDKAAA